MGAGFVQPMFKQRGANHEGDNKVAKAEPHEAIGNAGITKSPLAIEGPLASLTLAVSITRLLVTRPPPQIMSDAAGHFGRLTSNRPIFH